MISKGYLSSYSAWTDIQMVKVLEDTSESLTAAQKQWVVDNVLKPTNEVAKKYGYKKTVTVRKIDAGTHEYDVAVKNYETARGLYEAYLQTEVEPEEEITE